MNRYMYIYIYDGGLKETFFIEEILVSRADTKKGQGFIHSYKYMTNFCHCSFENFFVSFSSAGNCEVIS